MQLAIAPLLNHNELLTAVYLDNYIIDPEENKMFDMINLVRETGDNYHSPYQVENAAADGAYAKNKSVKDYYSKSLDVSNEWVTLRWDYAHQVNLAEGDARVGKNAPTTVEDTLDLAQNITKMFRYGKEYARTIFRPSEECVSLTDMTDSDNIEEGAHEEEEDENIRSFEPVIRSNLKFAAHGATFLHNYLNNLPKYVARLNQILAPDANEDVLKIEKCKGLLSQVDVKHVTLCYGLYDIYRILAKAQHGVSKVNQLPWEYDDKIEALKLDLNSLKNETFEGDLSKNEKFLEMGVFPNGMPIYTKPRKATRSANELSNSSLIEEGKTHIKTFLNIFITSIEDRIVAHPVTSLTKDVFKDWKEDKLINLVELANASDSGRNYGEYTTLFKQFKSLKHIFSQVDGTEEIDKWLSVCTNHSLYNGCEDILHLALSCFVKVPLEATAESIGSVINRHGRKERCSMHPNSLSSECQVAWNGPQEFSKETTQIIDEALKEHFKGNKCGMRFFVVSKMKFISSTISSYMNKPSRINFQGLD